ncbi:MAG: antibiotic biosynthesis monooxygenase [Candidatus Aquilonibacter sp.]|jgi:heme-degrading monooxygenase HmoA
MIEVLYRYRVHPAQVRAFEHAYGPQGPWARLFSTHRGYRRTRLFRNKTETGVYLCMDVWESKADWDHFRAENAAAYSQLDRELHLLYVEELLLGYYEGEEEYQASRD